MHDLIASYQLLLLHYQNLLGFGNLFQFSLAISTAILQLACCYAMMRSDIGLYFEEVKFSSNKFCTLDIFLTSFRSVTWAKLQDDAN